MTEADIILEYRLMTEKDDDKEESRTWDDGYEQFQADLVGRDELKVIE